MCDNLIERIDVSEKKIEIYNNNKSDIDKYEKRKNKLKYLKQISGILIEIVDANNVIHHIDENYKLEMNGASKFAIGEVSLVDSGFEEYIELLNWSKNNNIEMKKIWEEHIKKIYEKYNWMVDFIDDTTMKTNLNSAKKILEKAANRWPINESDKTQIDEVDKKLEKIFKNVAATDNIKKLMYKLIKGNAVLADINEENLKWIKEHNLLNKITLRLER